MTGVQMRTGLHPESNVPLSTLPGSVTPGRACRGVNRMRADCLSGILEALDRHVHRAPSRAFHVHAVDLGLPVFLGSVLRVIFGQGKGAANDGEISETISDRQFRHTAVEISVYRVGRGPPVGGERHVKRVLREPFIGIPVSEGRRGLLVRRGRAAPDAQRSDKNNGSSKRSHHPAFGISLRRVEQIVPDMRQGTPVDGFALCTRAGRVDGRRY